MIAQLAGTLAVKEVDRIVVMTASGVGYEVLVPLSVFEGLPRVGAAVHLHTHLVVRDDGWALFGFSAPFERVLFQRLLTANGVGPALALALLSHLPADRLMRALREKDLGVLQSVPRVGRKKAERLVVDLADKLDDLAVGAEGARPSGGPAEDAIRALVSLGYSAAHAEAAVRAALELDANVVSTSELIRRALAKAGGT